MGSIIGILMMVVVALVVIGKLTQSIQKSTQRMQGKGRCKSCNSRLKAYQGKYANVCRKCGATQNA